MELTASQIIFYIVGAMILGFGFLAVTSLKIFRAAIYLLFCLISVAGLYFMMAMEFIAAVQIVVYVGGIVVLIIFAIFLTHNSGENMPVPKKGHELVSFFIAILGFGICFGLIYREMLSGSNLPAVEPTVTNIGLKMLDFGDQGYVLPFEVISILLLVAMVGAIVIAMKSSKAKTNSPAKTISNETPNS